MPSLLDLQKQLEAIFQCAPGPHEIRIFGQKYHVTYDGQIQSYYHDKGFSLGAPRNPQAALYLLQSHFSNGVFPNNCYIVANRVSDNYQIATKRGKIGDVWYPSMGYCLTKESDIRGYCSLIIDLDRSNKTYSEGQKQVASDSELEHLKEVAQEIEKYIAQFGLSPNYCLMSGNGYQTIYFFEPQANVLGTKSSIKRILEGLHLKFKEKNADIDTSLSDPRQNSTWHPD